MPEVKVIRKLYKRIDPSTGHMPIGVTDIGEVLNVVGPFKGQRIEGIGNWYRDGANNYYWGGGLIELKKPEKEFKQRKTFDHSSIGEQSLKWWIKDFKIEEVWKYCFGENVNVAILDSGINQTHPDLQHAVARKWNVVDNNENVEDQIGHGTHCAGIVAGQGINVVGVAPASNLFIVKVLGAPDELNLEHVKQGILWAFENGADIISMSLYFSEDYPDLLSVQQLMAQCKARREVSFIAAAGNRGKTNKVVNQFPASFPECISVGAVDQLRKRYSRSNLSPFLSIMAPGENIESTYTSPDYKSMSDTSFATPYVAGVMSLLLSYCRKNNYLISLTQLEDILKFTADDNGVIGKDNEFGFGIINPTKAFNKLINLA